MEGTGGSAFFNSIGLGSLDVGYVISGLLVLILVLLILFIVQLVKVNKMKKRMDQFMKGKEGKSLEQDLAAIFEDNNFLKISADKNKKDIRSIQKQLEKAYQSMGLVKYDAFHQMGGQLSFSLCLLNENKDGFILNSVHSTDGCYSYTKEIKGGESSISLGEEEAQALSIAMGEQ